MTLVKELRYSLRERTSLDMLVEVWGDEDIFILQEEAVPCHPVQQTCREPIAVGLKPIIVTKICNMKKHAKTMKWMS